MDNLTIGLFLATLGTIALVLAIIMASLGLSTREDLEEYFGLEGDTPSHSDTQKRQKTARARTD